MCVWVCVCVCVVVHYLQQERGVATWLEHSQSHTVQQDGQNADTLKPCDTALRVNNKAESEH